jgi:TolA-binding protein
MKTKNIEKITVTIISIILLLSTPVFAQEDAAPSNDAALSATTSEKMLGAIAENIKSVDFEGAKCNEPEAVVCPEQAPCPECPPPLQALTSLTLMSENTVLASDREVTAGMNLGVLRDEVAKLSNLKKVKKDYVSFLIIEADTYMKMYRELPASAEALYLKSELLLMNKEYEGRLVVLAKLLFEYPESEFVEKAVSGIRGLFTGKLKKALKYDKGITEGSTVEGWADRYSIALGLLHEFSEKKYLPYLMVEYDEFLERYPRHSFAEQALRFKAEGYANAKKKNHLASAFTLKWLVDLYPQSSSRSESMFELARVYEKELKAYGKAVNTLKSLVAGYPDARETLASYQKSAELYDKKLKNSPGAINSLEAIVTKYPKDTAALAAFRYMADLQVSSKQPAEAVKSLNRLADMFKGVDSAVEALIDASKIAGKMKDYQLQIDELNRIVDEYPNREEAVISLNTVAEINLKQLKDTAAAINIYKSLIKKYPSHKLADGARKKVDKLLSQ